MPNDLCIALAQNKETFNDCRLFLFEALGKNKDLVIKLENASIDVTIPYYISYIEYRGINFLEALIFYKYDLPDASFNSLLRGTIVNVFRKLEDKDINFIPY